MAETGAQQSRRVADVNAVVGGYLRDLAFAQSSQQKMFGYKRAAAAILALDRAVDRSGRRLTARCRGSLASGRAPRASSARFWIPASRRPSNRRSSGASAAQTSSGGAELRRHFLSRAEVRRVLADPAFAGPTLQQYRGDLQMHSEWSDGSPDGAGDCRRLPSAWLSIRGGHRSFVRTEDRRRDVDGRGRPTAARHRRRQRRGAAISSGCCRALKRTSTRLASWTSPTMRRPPSTWCWPRRIRGCERTRIRPTACWPRSRTRRSGSWPTRAAGSPDRARV